MRAQKKGAFFLCSDVDLHLLPTALGLLVPHSLRSRLTPSTSILQSLNTDKATSLRSGLQWWLAVYHGGSPFPYQTLELLSWLDLFSGELMDTALGLAFVSLSPCPSPHIFSQRKGPGHRMCWWFLIGGSFGLPQTAHSFRLPLLPFLGLFRTMMMLPHPTLPHLCSPDMSPRL